MIPVLPIAPAQPKRSHLTGSTIVGYGLIVMAVTAYGLHLAFPARPIGELLIGSFLTGGLTMIGLPQKAAPSPIQPKENDHV